MQPTEQQHPADIAEQLALLDKKSRDIAFIMLSNEKKVAVFSYFDVDI